MIFFLWSVWGLLLYSVQGRALPVDFRLVASAVGAALLPGWLLIPFVVRDRDSDVLEKVAIAFGLTLVFWTVVSAVVTAAGKNAVWAAHGLLWIEAVLLILTTSRALGRWQRRFRRPDLLELLLWAGLIYVVFLLYQAGGLVGTVPDGEEGLHILITRKLLGNESVSLNNILYKPNEPYSYVFAPFYLLLAVVSHLSQTDPIVTYVKFRFLTGLVSVAVFYSLATRFLENRTVARVVALVTLSLILSNVAGYRMGYWAQLAPLTDYRDVGGGILVPLLLYGAIRSLQEVKGSRSWLWISAGFFAAVLAIHSRDALQVTISLGCLWLALLALGPRDHRFNRLTQWLVMALTLGVSFRWLHAHLVGHIHLREAFNHDYILQMLRDQLRHPLRAVLGPPINQGYTGPPEITFQPELALSFLLVPFLWAVRDRLWGWWMAGTTLCFLLLMRIHLVSLAFLAVTFSEMLVTPARYFIHTSYLLFGILIALHLVYLRSLYRRWNPEARRPLLWIARAGVLCFLYAKGILLPILGLLGTLGARFGDLFILWALLGTVAAFWWLRRRPGIRVDFAGLEASPMMLAGLCAFLLAVVLTPRGPSLWAQAETRARQVSVTHFEQWYRANQPSDLPYELYGYIAKQVPPGRVFVHRYDRMRIFTIPVVLNQYVLTGGTFFSTEQDFLRDYLAWKKVELPGVQRGINFYNLMGEYYSSHFLADRPGYNPEKLSEAVPFFIHFGVDYVVVSPEDSQTVGRRLEAAAEFSKVYDQGGWMLFERRAGAGRS